MDGYLTPLREGLERQRELHWHGRRHLEAWVAAPPRPVSRAERSPGPQTQPCTLYFYLFYLSGVLEPKSHESPCPPYGQGDFPDFEVPFFSWM